MPISFSLLTIGPALFPAIEVSLICLPETVFGPAWVYVGGYEAPPLTAIIGGAAVVLILRLCR